MLHLTMTKNRRVEELMATVDAAKRETTASAMEILEHLHRALLAIPPFTLKDGTKARLDPYIKPEINAEGEATCGVDVLLENVGHLEFTVRNSGWGKSFLPPAERSPPSKGR